MGVLLGRFKQVQLEASMTEIIIVTDGTVESRTANETVAGVALVFQKYHIVLRRVTVGHHARLKTVSAKIDVIAV